MGRIGSTDFGKHNGIMLMSCREYNQFALADRATLPLRSLR
jgi:hypothetical protein